LAFLGGLGKAPTFLVPIINPPFADNSPHLVSLQLVLLFIKFVTPHLIKDGLLTLNNKKQIEKTNYQHSLYP